MEVIKITRKNIEKYYNRPDGNIWYREKGDNDFQIMEGYSVDECLNALAFGIDMVFISVNWGRRATVGYDAD